MPRGQPVQPSRNKFQPRFEISKVAWKQLSQVETRRGPSTQGEFNGSAPLIELLGRPKGATKKRVPTRFLRITDDPERCIEFDGTSTWYNARFRKTHRAPEARLYMKKNIVTKSLEEGELVLFFLKRSGVLTIVVFDKGCSAEAEVRRLLSLSVSTDIQLISDAQRDAIAQQPLLRSVAIELGLLTVGIDEAIVRKAIKSGRGDFPGTEQMSKLARETAAIAKGADADSALLAFMQQEEAIFFAVEAALVADVISKPFKSVDHFMEVSLSLQNRRKSRAGKALENHFAWLLEQRGVSFDAQAKTEGKNKPDFIMPGQVEYADPNYPSSRLVMVAAKRTLKDRWRQVLREANRTEHKHLLTLDSDISEAQLQDMQAAKVIVAMPKSIRDTYPPGMATQFLTVEKLIRDIEDRISGSRASSNASAPGS